MELGVGAACSRDESRGSVKCICYCIGFFLSMEVCWVLFVLVLTFLDTVVLAFLFCFGEWVVLEDIHSEWPWIEVCSFLIKVVGFLFRLFVRPLYML